MFSSTVTCTSISCDYEEPSDAGSPEVVVYEYDGLLMHTPEYPEYLASFDAEAPIKDQPLPHDALPTALSLSYVADSDSEEKPKEDPVNYLADGGDDTDDDDDDDDKEHEAFKDDDEEEEEHLAPVDSSTVHAVDHIPMSDTVEALIAEYASTPTLPSLPPSLLTPLSSPLPQIPSPPLPVPYLPLPLPSPPTHASPTYAKALLGYRPVGIRLRATSPSTHHLSEIPSLPLLLPSTTHRDDLPEADMPLWKRACFTTPTSRFEVGESSSAITDMQAGHTLAHRVDYGFVDTVDTSIRASKCRAMTAIGEVNDRVTDLAITQRQDAQELYVHCEDARDDRALLGAQAIKAHIKALQRDVDVLHRQMISDEDRLTAHIQHEHDRFRELIGTAEAEPHDGPKDAENAAKKTTATTTPMTDDQIKALIAQGVADALAEHDTNRSRKGDDSHDLGTGVRRQNSHVKTISHDVAYAMTWKTLKKMMTDKYYPRGNIKKLEIELWNLEVKESDEAEKYVGSLTDMIQGSVMASKPKKMQDAIEFATKLMDPKICTLAEHQAENKRKFEDTSRNNQNQQQPFKRHNVARAYTAGLREKNTYRRSKPMCPKCNYHHNGQFAPKCANCKRTSHLTRDCRSPVAANNN
ncbi:hypothetical protein Tco_0112085 [Tanacetum coccineum]